MSSATPSELQKVALRPVRFVKSICGIVLGALLFYITYEHVIHLLFDPPWEKLLWKEIIMIREMKEEGKRLNCSTHPCSTLNSEV